MKSFIINVIYNQIGYVAGISALVMLTGFILMPNALGFSTTINPDATNGIEVGLCLAGLACLSSMWVNWLQATWRKK